MLARAQLHQRTHRCPTPAATCCTTNPGADIPPPPMLALIYVTNVHSLRGGEKFFTYIHITFPWPAAVCFAVSQVVSGVTK